MANGHGGKRPGAGRKKKNRGGETAPLFGGAYSSKEHYETAEDYLLAVIQGKAAPDAVRVQAAKTLIAYQKAKQRAPVESPSPKKLQEKTKRDVATAVVDEFEQKAAHVRAKFAKKRG